MSSPATAAAQLAAWERLAGAFWQVSQLMEEDLHAARLPTLSWYSVLERLGASPGHHLRMCELAGRIQLSRSGLTRLADRLEKEGLIERVSCPKDRRVLHAQLTPKGAELLERMRPLYESGVHRHFATHLNTAELKQLGALMDKVSAPPPPA